MKVKQVAGALQRKHINCGEMHSDLDQATRDDVMFKFKSGQFDVLVATDVISRGIDIDDITMVINYDVPHDAEDYVHRIGRTARAARTGTAITFVSEDDAHYFQQIEKFLGNEVEKLPLPEELGQAPEYNTEERPRKNNSAKNRRRNDRNQTAHKDKKQQNRRQRNQQQDAQNRPEQREQHGENDENKSQPTHNRRRNQPRRDSNAPTTTAENQPRKRNERKANDTERQTKNGEQRPRNKRRGNVEGNYKKRNAKPNAAAEPQKATTNIAPKPARKENIVRKFFKRLLKL